MSKRSRLNKKKLLKRKMSLELLPENVSYNIYRYLFAIELLPELKLRCIDISIEQCVKMQPYVKTLSYISNQTNIELNDIKLIVDRSRKIYKTFNNLYNCVLYFHVDNLHYV